MTDAFEKTGDGIFKGIELSEQEARLRPKGKIEARAVDLHGKMFLSFQPTVVGDLAFMVLVDGKPTKSFQHEYVGGMKFEDKDLNPVNSEGQPASPNKAIAFVYTAFARTPGQHSIQVLMGKEVLTDEPGKLDFQVLQESPQYALLITEGEF